MLSKYTAEDFKEGQVLIFDKPLEWTSFQLVSKVRGLIKKSCKLRKIKVGHAGTLDPLATGLMIICTGKFTKRIQEFQGLRKEYTGTITLGATTPSYDLETEVDKNYPTTHITEALLRETLPSFVGEIKQYPPIFSAVKKDGKRLYEYARKGQEVKPNPRMVTVDTFELTRIALPDVDFRVVCSKGTYIRSLANDFGKALESGAHLSVLRRTKIGEYTVDRALTFKDFIEILPNNEELY